MGYPDFPIQDAQNRSYIPASEMLAFLKSYAKSFRVEEIVKFEHYVIRVRPIGESQWEVIESRDWHTVTHEITRTLSSFFYCRSSTRICQTTRLQPVSTMVYSCAMAITIHRPYRNMPALKRIAANKFTATIIAVRIHLKVSYKTIFDVVIFVVVFYTRSGCCCCCCASASSFLLGYLLIPKWRNLVQWSSSLCFPYYSRRT